VLRLTLTEESHMGDDPRKPIEVASQDAFSLPKDRSEDTTLAQWRAASDALKRFNEAMMRIGEAEAEAAAGYPSGGATKA
jgi:hypothetical protein